MDYCYFCEKRSIDIQSPYCAENLLDGEHIFEMPEFSENDEPDDDKMICWACGRDLYEDEMYIWHCRRCEEISSDAHNLGIDHI